MKILLLYFFFFNDTATTEIYTLSLHDALPISLIKYAVIIEQLQGLDGRRGREILIAAHVIIVNSDGMAQHELERSEEHTSELQSRQYLVCRLLLEKKKKKIKKSKRTREKI